MIVVFGSLNVDFFMHVDRLPRPGETVIGGDYFLVPGGKGGNQALAAARAAEGSDVRVAMAGCVGRDDWAATAIGLLEEAGVDLTAMSQDSETLTGCASILVEAGGENAIGVASGSNMRARATQVPDDWLGEGYWLVLQMEVDPAENWRLIERAHRRGARVVLNVAPAAPVPSEVLDVVDLLVVNEVEARMVAEAEGGADGGPAELTRSLSARHGLICITTLGADGAIAHGPDGAWSVAPLSVTPVDTTGAGDAFVGCLTAALVSGRALPEALRFGSAGAALSCTVAGTQSSFARAGDIADALAGVPEVQALKS